MVQNKSLITLTIIFVLLACMDGWVQMGWDILTAISYSFVVA